ncbi:meso-butanediol dehydrogenase / (S,S)-butanediol dehydrogenase / diacetyl reductase (plasmid) [Ensifer sp. WSM1721]|uniref:SDR family NAD(P)-dependent oxidoreductase n=1 Tax=Ensifer sp. WSM1721 TaxID=1041159 RepID=UPI0018DCF728|nr:SDR family NAD(P)-dependent oxidoreductase [Ensifer sp. WSM1721]
MSSQQDMGLPAARENAVITGAASGIGAAVARRLFDRGANVFLIDRDIDRLRSVFANVDAAGGTVKLFQADVTDNAKLKALFAEVDAHGGVDNVVHCAGVARLGTVIEMDEASFDFVLDVNLKGTFLLAKNAMPSLMKRRGSFTAIASDAGTQGATGYAAYCASKHGVVGLIKSMALDHGPQGVRCNAICPGFVETPMLDQLFADNPSDRGFYEKTVPLGRFARPNDVAELAAFISSPAGSYLNGAIIALDGGSTAGYFSSASAAD